MEARMKDLYTRKDLQKAVELNEFGTKSMEVGKFLTAVPREEANLEAEGRETAITNFNNDGIPEHYVIKGPRHSSGGVPLKLKEDSFIFSDTKAMKIKDQKILQMFGMSPKGGGYTPAQIAKKYDLNKYKKILLDPNSDKLQRETAELMITNYNRKLGQLALLQESQKGFPQGIPDVAMPYVASMQLDPNALLGTLDQGQEEMPAEEDQGEAKYGKNIISKLKKVKEESYFKARGGTPGLGKRLVKFKKSLPKADDGMIVPEDGQTYMDWAVKAGVPINDPNYAELQNLIWNSADKQFVPRKGTTPKEKTVVTTNTKVIKRQNIPANATKHDESSPDYDPRKVKVGDYIKGKDGRYRKATNIKGGGLAGGSFSGADNYNKFFGSDIKQDAEKAKVILSAKAKVPGSGIKWDGKKFNVSGDAIANLSLEERELITRIAGYGGAKGFGAKEYGVVLGDQYENKYGLRGFIDPELLEYQYWKSRKENWNKTANEFHNLSPEAKKANRVGYLKKLGYGDDELKTLSDKIDDPEKLYTPKFTRGWGRKKVTKNGKTYWTGDDKSLVGRVQKSFDHDQFRPHAGDDYALGWEHADFYKENDPTLEFEDVPDEVLTTEEKEKAKEEFRAKSGIENAPWFLQDIINTTGAAADLLRVKKYMPWQAAPSLHLPEPVYYDPTRELAANAETANIGTQGAQLFAGPQAFNARYAQIQGQAAKNAADILGRYNNLNVSIANQYENTKAQLLNQDELNRANAATSLFDKTTIANQMYDSEKNMARQNLRNAYRDAITNKANAQVMNTLYPQYHIDPSTGGQMVFVEGRDLDDSASTSPDVMTTMDQLRKDHPGWSDETYRKAAMNETTSNNSYDDDEDNYMDRYARMMRGTNRPYGY